jgi:hypothetical protein
MLISGGGRPDSEVWVWKGYVGQMTCTCNARRGVMGGGAGQGQLSALGGTGGVIWGLKVIKRAKLSG